MIFKKREMIFKDEALVEIVPDREVDLRVCHRSDLRSGWVYEVLRMARGGVLRIVVPGEHAPTKLEVPGQRSPWRRGIDRCEAGERRYWEQRMGVDGD